MKCLLDSEQWERAHDILVRFLISPLLLVELKKSKSHEGERQKEVMMDVESTETPDNGHILRSLISFLTKLRQNKAYLQVYVNKNFDSLMNTGLAQQGRNI